MRRAAPPLALALALALAVPAASQTGAGGHGSTAAPVIGPASPAPRASIGFDAVRPKRLDVVAGESVTWTNDSVRVHTVTADDDSFDSGRLSSAQTFVHRFAATGEVAYHCTLHPLIQGLVAVYDLLLDAPAQPAAPGRPYGLSGRAALAAGTGVTIEADSGAGFAPVGTAQIDHDGRFDARITPTESATYRAVAGAVASPPVRLDVLDRRVALTVRRVRGQLQLHARVTPTSRGGRLVLQLFVPERFGWWPVQSRALNGASAATFTVRTKRRLHARVRYTLADGATALATSRTVRVGRPLR